MNTVEPIEVPGGTIFERIPRIMGEVGHIAKGRKNAQQNYAFRGIDDAYSAFQPLFAKYGVFCLPEVIESKREEREAKNGGVLIYTTLTVKHTFCASDGSVLHCITVGEAMDSGDKSSNKAMSAAMKYALLEVFCVPTEADNDTENHSPEPVGRQTSQRPQSAPPTPPAPQNTPTPPPDAGNGHSESTWRNEVITFGKNMGTTLGELSEQSLKWYIEKAEFKKDSDVRKDTSLGRALDAAYEEMVNAGEVP